MPGPLDIVRDIIGWVVQRGPILWLGSALFGMSGLSLRQSFTDYLPSALILLFLFVVGMVPAHLLHHFAHQIVLGRASAIVWIVMALDAPLIGTMAALGGSALYLGCRCGLTWRGWRAIGASESS